MQPTQEILKKYWNYDSFRPLQAEIISTVLKGSDCLALLPTGGGKSICFQVPAMVMKGLCLVVTPLIALMKDQVENLRKKGITSFWIHSGMTRKEVIATLKVAGSSNCKFLYVSPERLETVVFREYLPSLDINLIAVDEAHCISQWGYDFRPSYLRIAALREELPEIPILALSASATPVVQNDICDNLLFRERNIFRQSFERPNLSYSVFRVESKINKVLDVLKKVNGTAIVYCGSRKKTKEISNTLSMHGHSSDYYHAGLTQDERNDKQASWINDRTRVIVCTNAFGMGIDKPGVRAVIHFDTPDCLENYYQEAGRAGRDGKRSYAVLLTNDKEISDLKASPEKRFPDPVEVRKVYKHLMNHLQIPAGTGEGMHFELDIQSFIKDFKLESSTVISALKTLEHEELLFFSEQVFVQPRLQVVCGRERMFEFEKNFPQLEQLLKTLLRTYEGILDQPVNIDEKKLAFLLKQSTEDVIQGIKQMKIHGVISYLPRKEKPQVYLLQNRVRSDDLRIDVKRYNQRKAQFEERINAIVNYVYDEKSCRSAIIGKYFGDEHIKNCRICDNCLRQKKMSLHSSEFGSLNEKIMIELQRNPVTLNQLLEKMDGVSTDKVNEMLRFLQEEEKITITSGGLIVMQT